MSSEARSPAGGVVVWKPAGITSREALVRAGRAVGARRLGHAGTLDPLAAGIIILLGGEARKFQDLFTRHIKEYQARVWLGMRSHSEDAEGPLWCPYPRVRVPSEARVSELVAGFQGEYRHVPPRFSAVRVQGQRSYKRARRGENIDPEPRTVILHDIHLRTWEPPRMEIDVRCDPGTYIRSLARDIGETLGSGAFLSGLRRTASGGFRESDAIPLTQLQPSHWLSLEDLLRHEPRVDLEPELARQLSNGLIVTRPGSGTRPGRNVAWCEGKVAGLVEARGPRLHPRRWLSRERA